MNQLETEAGFVWCTVHQAQKEGLQERKGLFARQPGVEVGDPNLKFTISKIEFQDIYREKKQGASCLGVKASASCGKFRKCQSWQDVRVKFLALEVKS